MTGHWDNMYWLGDGDPLKIKALEKTGMMEYFIMLDKKMIEAERKKRQAEQDAAAGLPRSNRKR